MTKTRRPDDLLSKINYLDKRLTKKERVTKYNDEDVNDAPPLPPTVTMTLRVKEVKKRLEFRAVVTWGLVSPNTCQADVDRWVVQVRPTDSGGTPIDTDTIGGNPYQLRREKNIDNKGETDVHAVFNDLQKPKKWYWQARVAIIDKAHRQGPFSSWTAQQLPVQEALPKPPTPTGVDLIFDTLEKTRWDRIRAIVQWNEVLNWDVPGGDIEEDMRGYQVALRRTDSGGTPVGSFVRKKVVEAKDGDADTVTHTVFQKGIKKQYYYQARVRSVDRWNRRGDWSAWTTAEQATNDTTTPPAPSNVTGFIDQHRIVVEWDATKDAADTDILHEDITNFQVQVATDSGFTNIIRDVRTAGEHKSFKVRKPATTYWVRVRTHDASWNKSSWISTSASKITPNTPSVAISFDAGGPKRSRYRAIGTVTAGAADTDDDVAFYRVQFVHKATNVAPTGSEPRSHQDTDPDDDLKVIFKNIRKSHFTFMRVRSVDHQGRKSAFSGWTAGGQPTASSTPATPTGVNVVVHPRRIVTKWNEAANDDDEVAGYKVEVRRGGALRETRFTRHAHHRYLVPTADRDLQHEVRVYAVDDMGNLSSAATDVNGTPNEKLDETDLIDAFSQSSGKTYSFNGNIRLAGSPGAFQTGDPSTEGIISMSRLDGKDEIRFKPLSGTQTVLAIDADGVRWGLGASPTNRSMLARDATLQLYQMFTTGSPNVIGSTACKLYLSNRDGAAGLGLHVKFNTGAGAIKQLAHNG